VGVAVVVNEKAHGAGALSRAREDSNLRPAD
jgi:hypothetical protein